MIVKSERLEKANTALLNAVAKLQRGQTFLYADMVRACGIERNDSQWTSLAQKFKASLLREQGVALICVASVGYRLATLDEQIMDVPEYHLERSQRQAWQGRKKVESTPTKGMTVKQREIKIRSKDICARVRRDALRGAKLTKALGKTKTIPVAKKPKASQGKTT